VHLRPKTSSPENVRNSWGSAFATDLLQDRDWKDVKVWVFGHTHFTTEFERCGIKVLSNQRGYVISARGEQKGKKKHEKMDKKIFNVRKVVHV